MQPSSRLCPAVTALLLTTIIRLFAGESNWKGETAPTIKSGNFSDLVISGRPADVYRHGVRPEWGYKEPQQDTFIVVHPKIDRAQAPLYVVLHSAGHDVVSCLKCTSDAGNHDIYRSPDDFYALYLDCRANMGDWWWGGMHAGDAELTRRNSGSELSPAEKRVMDSIAWVMTKYQIDPNRVYLCGNSMGGSGTLGIGLRHGDVFAAIKANVPAGIEHVSHRMGFPPQSIPETLQLPDPPVAVDYSAQNDGWSAGHDRFVKAMNERRCALYFYWGPFGHANNHAEIEKINDLINSFDWLSVRKNEAYPVFSNASGNDPLPWPDNLKSQAAGQVNAFFRWKNLTDAPGRLEMSLFLVTPATLKTRFPLPAEAAADVSLRRIQNTRFAPGDSFKWTFRGTQGEGKAGSGGLITIPGLKFTAEPVTLTVIRQ